MLVTDLHPVIIDTQEAHQLFRWLQTTDIYLIDDGTAISGKDIDCKFLTPKNTFVQQDFHHKFCSLFTICIDD